MTTATARANGSPETETHDGLLAALLAVQEEAPTLPKDKTGARGAKYTPLDTIVERIGPILRSHNLVWTTMPCRDEQGEPALRYRLAHVPSGEDLEGLMPLMLGNQDSQGMGAAITYARRYSLCAVLNLVADDDDDGERARKSAGAGEAVGDQKLSKQAAEAIEKIVNAAELSEHLPAKLRGFGVSKVTDLTREQGMLLHAWATGTENGGGSDAS